ncbi:MAG: hypothetical protein FWC54_01235 [Actinomycetia bacterium]|nr:hypothetical protein [Actinomycetes bacterium]
MDRRTFLKSAGGLVLFGLTSVLVRADSSSTPGASLTRASAVIGPLLRDDIVVRRTSAGASAYSSRLHVFDVDALGLKFLALADGTHTIDDIATHCGQKSRAAEVALFFVTLGQAGYLQNRVEVSLVERAA